MFLRVATLAALLFAPFYAQAPAKTRDRLRASGRARAHQSPHQGRRRPRGDPGPQVDARHRHLVGPGLRHQRADGNLRRHRSRPRHRQDDGHRHRRHHGRVRRLARVVDVADDRTDAQGRQGAHADQARRRLLQRAARSEDLSRREDDREDHLRRPPLLQGQPQADRRRRGLRLLRRRHRAPRRQHQHPRDRDGHADDDQRRGRLQEVRQADPGDAASRSR